MASTHGAWLLCKVGIFRTVMQSLHMFLVGLPVYAELATTSVENNFRYRDVMPPEGARAHGHARHTHDET